MARKGLKRFFDKRKIRATPRIVLFLLAFDLVAIERTKLDFAWLFVF